MPKQPFHPYYSNERPNPLTHMDVETIKHHYGSRFKELIDILNYSSAGNPADTAVLESYDLEARSIMVQLRPGMSISLIQDLIYLEFGRWFVHDEEIIGSISKYRVKAEKIYEWLQKQRED